MSTGRSPALAAAAWTPPRPDQPACWPELIYRLIEHYKWEPQHLGIRPAKAQAGQKGESLSAFYGRIMRQEVPLNLLFSLVLAWASADTIRAILETFTFDGSSPVRERFDLCYPYDADYTQPDICLQSERTRVFVEVKWSATITLEQVQKYLCLHADLDERLGPRRPTLLFLTRDNFGAGWRPRQGWTGPAGSFVREAVAATGLPRKLTGRLSDAVLERYAAVSAGVVYGFATWCDLHTRLVQMIPDLGEAHRDAEASLLEGFASDLARRLEK